MVLGPFFWFHSRGQMSQINHQIQVASYLKSNYGQRLVVPVLLDLQLVIIQNLYEAFQCDDINFILIGLFLTVHL